MRLLRSKRIAVVLSALALGIWSSCPVLAAPPEPCSLLTRAAVEQVVGKLNGSPKADKEGDAARCDYQFANGKDAMEVWVFPADAIDRAKKESEGAGRDHRLG